MMNFREELDRILDCNKITVEKIYKEVLHQLQRMNSEELLKVTLLEFSVNKNEISAFTIKTDPYLYQELHCFNFKSSENASIVFNKLHDKLKADGCTFKDVSKTNFRVII